MKALIFLTICCVALLSVSCKNEVDTTNLTSGKWYITDLKRNIKPEKRLYNGYTFKFYSNHKIYAFLNDFGYSGTWDVSSDFATDDEPMDSEYLFLNFSKCTAPAKLNGEYILLSNTSDTLILMRDDMNTGQTYVVMAKIK